MARSNRGRKRQPAPGARSSWVAPGSIVALAISIAVGYVVVKRSDDISEVAFAGAGIAFHGSASPRALTPDEQAQRAQQIQTRVEQEVHEAAPATSPPPAVADLTGTWALADGTATWTVTVENGYLMFREHNIAAPDVISAAGYGSFDGHTWSLHVQTILGATGTAALDLQPDGTLQGDANIDGGRFLVALYR